MVQPVQPIEPKSHKAVQSFDKKIELLEGLSEKALTILEMLGAGNTQAYCAKVIPCSKSLVSYWKNRLIAIGALRLQVKDVFNTYSLTPYGSKILMGSEVGVREVVVLEDHAVKFRVLERERRVVEWRKLGEPRNWVKLGLCFDGVRVVLTEGVLPNVIIHPGKLRGFDPDELEVQAGRIVERVRCELMSRFGLVIADDGCCLHKPIFRFYSDEAKELVKFGTTNVEGVGSIDNSPPERVPHEEYVGKDLAKARLNMPNHIRHLEAVMVEVRESVALIAKSQADLLEIFNSLLNGSARTEGVNNSRLLKEDYSW